LISKKSKEQELKFAYTDIEAKNLKTKVDYLTNKFEEEKNKLLE
jgi:hypothetical protein